MRRARRSGLAAFTLVELLVVIGIIAVLLAIVLPALARTREAARQIVCANNERHIAMAIFMYVNDNRGKLPLQVYTSDPDEHPLEMICMSSTGMIDYENGTLWPYVAPDIATRQKLLNCPSDPDPRCVMGISSDVGATTFVYSTNVQRNFSYRVTWEINKCSWGAPVLFGSTDHGLTGVHAMPLSMVRHPEHKVLVIDDFSPGMIITAAVDSVYIPHFGGTISELTSRHSGKGNITFFDGHCEPIDAKTFGGLTTSAETSNAYNYWANVWAD